MPVIGLTTVVSIAAEEAQSCAVLQDGSARCWGGNTSGGLGDGTLVDKWTPVPVSGLTGAVKIAGAGGGYHSCSVLTNGSVRCWGENGYGQVGDGTNTMRLTPVPVVGLP